MWDNQMKRHLRDKARSSPGTPEVAPRSGSVAATELLVLALFVLLTKAFLLSNLKLEKVKVMLSDFVQPPCCTVPQSSWPPPC